MKPGREITSPPSPQSKYEVRMGKNYKMKPVFKVLDIIISQSRHLIHRTFCSHDISQTGLSQSRSRIDKTFLQPRHFIAKIFSQPRHFIAKTFHSQDIFIAKTRHSQGMSQPRDVLVKACLSQGMSQPRHVLAKGCLSQGMFYVSDRTFHCISLINRFIVDLTNDENS